MAVPTRRDFVRSSGLLVVSYFSRRGLADPAAPRSLKISLLQELANATVRAVSPDGGKLCLEDWRVSGYPLRVVEVGTGRTVYTGRFQSRALTVGFFADSQAIFLEIAGGKGQRAHQQTLVDLNTSERTQGMRSFDPFEYWEQMSPIDGRNLLVAHYRNKPQRLEWLSRVEFPSYRELSRVVLPAQQSDSKPSADVSISADRNFAAYFFNNSVICRRTGDLEIRWTRPIESGLRAFPLVFSAAGDYIAATLAKGVPGRQWESYTPICIAIHDGRTGEGLARLPFGADNANGIALSPDGKLLAVISREDGSHGELVATAHIYEASSGQKLASVVHDHIRTGRRQFLEAGATVAFTSDGRYMITSGMSTKIWKLDPSA
jgi:hypothetical protein